MILQSLLNSVRYLFRHKILLLMMMIAWILTLMPFVFDGRNGCTHGECGMIIGTNYRDGLWFLAVANTAFKTWPFQMPVYAGATLQGYHYLPNLVAYIISFIGIPITLTYYILIPLFYISSMTTVAILFARKLRDTPLFVGLFLFCTFFGMHLSLITSLYHTGKIQNTVLINTFQATRLLESPHAALALLMLFIILLIIYTKGIITLKQSLLISCLLFLAFGTKFYVAFTILLIVGFNEIWILIQYRQWKNFIRNCFFFLLSTGMAVILFYNPFNTTKTGSIFIFSPFATVHHLIETPTLFHLPNMVLARYFLYEHGWSPRLFGIELFSTFLFALFYFGTRFIGFIQILKLYLVKKADRMTVIMSLVIMILITCAVLFIQKGDWYNPIQFAVPAAFLLNIFTAQLLHDIFKKQKTIGILVIILFVSLTLPANFVNAGYLQNPARLVIPEKEMEALTFLRNQPNGSVFVPIEENAESDTAYVSAFTSKPTYVNFTNVLQNADIPYEKRLSQVSDLKTADIANIDADYMYLALNRKQNIDFYNRIKNSAQLNEIFNNKTVIIYSLKKSM